MRTIGGPSALGARIKLGPRSLPHVPNANMHAHRWLELRRRLAMPKDLRMMDRAASKASLNRAVYGRRLCLAEREASATC